MDKLEKKTGNVNVTLESHPPPVGDFTNVEFPCPLCGAGLPVLASKRKKPYFICNHCGVQTFVRGKSGIARLREMVNAGILVSGRGQGASHGIQLYNRLEQLKLQKGDLKWKKGIFLRDEGVENAIQIIDAEIEKVEGELAKIAEKTKKENEK